MRELPTTKVAEAPRAGDDQLMDRARALAGDDCTLSWHDGDEGHRAIRITGCWPETAHRVGREIEEALFGPSDPESGRFDPRHGRVGYAGAAGFCAVWIR